MSKVFEVRLAVLSDLHAFSSDDGGDPPSYLKANAVPPDPDLFADLQAEITKHDIRADLLVCPGDLCYQADLEGFAYAWKRLHELKAALKARAILATCGNHDLDSRLLRERDDDPDPKGGVLTVRPNFPTEDSHESNQYWAQNFLICSPVPGLDALLLNTSAYHGGEPGEIEHGRVSTRTINAIRLALKDRPRARANVLVCHHHLIPHEGLKPKTDKEYVHKGTELLEALADETASPWLVIHGHRHIPRLSYGPSRSHIPVVFGAASFARIGIDFHNQFHVVAAEFDSHSSAMPLRGAVDTWCWTPSGRWMQQSPTGTRGLPPRCGFGFRGAIPGLASKVERKVAKSIVPSEWSDITTTIKELKYLTPTLFLQLEKELHQRKVAFAFDTHGLPLQIGKAR